MSDEVADSPKTETINTNGYWYGLLIPICLGLGGSFFSLMVLLSMTSWLLDNNLLFFFALLFQMGHAVLWPSSAAFIFFQGEKVRKLVIEKWGIAFTEVVRSMDGGDYCTTCLVCFQFQWDCIIFNRHIISTKSQGFLQSPQDIM